MQQNNQQFAFYLLTDKTTKVQCSAAVHKLSIIGNLYSCTLCLFLPGIQDLLVDNHLLQVNYVLGLLLGTSLACTIIFGSFFYSL